MLQFAGRMLDDLQGVKTTASPCLILKMIISSQLILGLKKWTHLLQHHFAAAPL